MFRHMDLLGILSCQYCSMNTLKNQHMACAFDMKRIGHSDNLAADHMFKTEGHLGILNENMHSKSESACIIYKTSLAHISQCDTVEKRLMRVL